MRDCNEILQQLVFFMKLIRSILLGGIAALFVSTSASADAMKNNSLPVSVSPDQWKLVFEDNFDGTALDKSKWKSLLPWAGSEDHHWHNDQYASYLTDEDVTVSSGQLHLACRKIEIQGKKQKFSYTAGMIHTSPTFRFKYGYAEVSAQAPMEAGPGLWPAFWTLADGWPPEFDIIELWTGEPRIHQGYCFAKPRGQGWNSYHEKIGPKGFHTYSMEWGPGYIFFLMDGKITKRVYGDDVTDKPQYLILNSGVGSGRGNKPPTEATIFPNSFDVDYCRVYARPEIAPFHNGSFEDGEHWPWTMSKEVEITDKESHDSKHSLQLAAGSTIAEQKLYGLKPNTTYTLIGWMKTRDVDNPVCIGVKNHGSKETRVSATAADWKQYSITFTTGQNETKAVVYCFNPNGPGGYFDELKLSENQK